MTPEDALKSIEDVLYVGEGRRWRDLKREADTLREHINLLNSKIHDLHQELSMFKPSED